MDKIPLTDDDVVALDDVAAGVAGVRILFCNAFAVGDAREWTLIDAGLYGSAGWIRRWAAERFGDVPPQAIVLTHAHFDHVGALDTLAEAWNVPVYAHLEEIPYLTGERAYPPPDPTVGGGMMSRMSVLYPREPIALHARLQELPSDGTVPTMPGWRQVQTPGHTAGHVSFFREADRTLIVGDAFCTTRQESFFDAIAQPPELHGPPAYFTTDWDAARDSVRRLAALEPVAIAPGHGRPVAGPHALAQLRQLAERFDEVARPKRGRYVDQPVRK